MDVSAAALLLRLVVSLGIVLALMMGAAAVLRKRALPGIGGGGRRRPVPIEVVGRQGLGRSASVAIVRAGGRALVLGITDNAVIVLADADLDVLDQEAPEGHGTALHGGAQRPGQTWMALLDSLRERTVRKA